MTLVKTVQTTHQDLLIRVMLAAAMADADVTDREFGRISSIVTSLPAFSGVDTNRIVENAAPVSALLEREDGIDRLLDEVANGLPERLYETAYALAVEVVSADVQAREEELNFLLMLEDRLELPKLPVAAIEYSARVRHRTL